jgi:hypothetical protein
MPLRTIPYDLRPMCVHCGLAVDQCDQNGSGTVLCCDQELRTLESFCAHPEKFTVHKSFQDDADIMDAYQRLCILLGENYKWQEAANHPDQMPLTLWLQEDSQ